MSLNDKQTVLHKNAPKLLPAAKLSTHKSGQ